MFSEQHCPHCDTMRNLNARLFFEHNILIQEINVSESADNEKLWKQHQVPDCDGFPLFVNTENGTTICGEISYKELVSWIQK